MRILDEDDVDVVPLHVKDYLDKIRASLSLIHIFNPEDPLLNDFSPDDKNNLLQDHLAVLLVFQKQFEKEARKLMSPHIHPGRCIGPCRKNIEIPKDIDI